MKKVGIKAISLLTSVFGKNNISRYLGLVAGLSRKMAQGAHMVQLKYDWAIAPQPEWCDHFSDQFYAFRTLRNSFWVERGVFGLLAIKPGADVLELCSGDGFNSYHFYALRASRVIAVDFDKTAVEHAKRNNQAGNVEFRLADIRTEMPEGMFDNVVWDAAIEHFTELEIAEIMTSIKQRLKPGGVLTGYTLLELPTGIKSNIHHEREFRSMEDLRSFFEPYFENVKVFETIYPMRHNLYFFASDGILPFDENWEHMTLYTTQ
jgi:SAM-dependent methyltransferase